jgi:hypothetical protein
MTSSRHLGHSRHQPTSLVVSMGVSVHPNYRQTTWSSAQHVGPTHVMIVSFGTLTLLTRVKFPNSAIMNCYNPAVHSPQHHDQINVLWTAYRHLAQPARPPGRNSRAHRRGPLTPSRQQRATHASYCERRATHASRWERRLMVRRRACAVPASASCKYSAHILTGAKGYEGWSRMP